jgi:hypothetical protein
MTLARMRRVLAAAGLAVLASGCATYSRYRPDTPPAIAAQDEAECHVLARNSARDVALTAFPYWWGPRFYGPAGPWPYGALGAWDDLYWGPAGDPAWRMDVERQIQQNCMRSRGYDLHRDPGA